MKLTKQAEAAFRHKYRVTVAHLEGELLEYMENLIIEMKRSGDMWFLENIEEFRQYAVEAMLYKVDKLNTNYKGQNDALQAARDILKNRSRDED